LREHRANRPSHERSCARGRRDNRERAGEEGAGVPLYLFYPADGGEPVILPQVLSEALVIRTITGETQ